MNVILEYARSMPLFSDAVVFKSANRLLLMCRRFGFRSVRLLTVLLFPLFWKPCTAQQPAADTNLVALFQNAHNLGVFNGNVLVIEKGRQVCNLSLGQSDTVSSNLLSAEHRFHIGSIAKEFNAVAIMMLAEKGKLKLTDRLSRFFPELPRWADSIQVLNLLQYTSGVPDVNWKIVKSDGDNWKELLKLERLQFTPGTRYNYNNNNVFLQRRIIAKVSGMGFNDFVIKKMLVPAGIKNAVIDPGEKDPLVARAFSNSGQEDPLAVPISGWVALTISDFSRWAAAISQFRLINAASTEKIISGFAPGNQSGLGGGLIEKGKMIRHIHDGTARNYQALLADYPDQGRTILLMTNNQQNNLYAIERSVRTYLDEGKLVPVRKSLLRDISKQLDTMAAAAFISYYNSLKQDNDPRYSFDSETTLNEIGYAYLRMKKVKDAIIVFELNTTLFPGSGNVFDSLGEVYYEQGDKENALKNYTRALQLDPGNETAKRIVTELSK